MAPAPTASRPPKEGRRQADAAELEAVLQAVAHDLRDPLQIAGGFIELALEDRDEVLTEEVRTGLAAADRALRRASGLLVDLLGYARTTTGPGAQVADVGTEELIRGVLEDLGPVLRERGVTVETEADPVVHADATLLSLVLRNLVGNAAKHAPDEAVGPVRVTLRSKDEGGWTLTVEDENPPIPDEDRERLLRPFERGSHSEAVRGHGLGLSIAHRSAERLGGTLSISTGDDGRNVFTVSVPG